MRLFVFLTLLWLPSRRMIASFFKSTVRYAMATDTEPSAVPIWQTAVARARSVDELRGVIRSEFRHEDARL